MVFSKALAGRLFAYTEWANHRVLDAAAGVDPEELVRDQGASFGSLLGTLVHMYAAEWVWFERWRGQSPAALPGEDELAAGLAALRTRWSALATERSAWLMALPEGALDARITYRTTKGDPHEGILGQLVQHVANHSTYHRGQVTLLLRQAGVKPVATDMVVWDREGHR